MNENAICPKCNLGFNAKENLKYGVSDVSSIAGQIERQRFRPLFKKRVDEGDEIVENTAVICPNCGKEFYLKGYRFFGLFAPPVMRVLVFILLLLFILVPIYILIKDLM